MVASQKVLDTLKQIGLNLYERKLWVALLSRGTATAGELAEIGKIPRSRCYDVLETLAEKGFVVIQNTKPLRYLAVSPAEALERAKKKIVKDAEMTAKRIDNLKESETLKELENLYKHGMDIVEPGELSGSLKGRDIINQQLETIFKNAKNRISIFTTSDMAKELVTVHAYQLKKAAKRGVKIKVAVNDIDDDILDAVKAFADVKRIDKKHPQGRFYIVDGKHVLLTLTGDGTHPSQDTAIWAHSEHAAKVFEPMFEHMWEHMESM